MNHQMPNPPSRQNPPRRQEAKTYVFDQPVKPRRSARPAQPSQRTPGRQVIREEGMPTRQMPAARSGKKPQARRSASVQRYRGDEARKISLAAKKKQEQQALLRKEARERAEIAEQERHIRTLDATHTKDVSLGTIILLLVCTVLFMVMINNMVRIKEYEADIRSLESRASTLSVQKKELSDRLEQKNDLNLIEEYAVNRLGMIKADQLSRRYISLEGDDKIELVQEESESAVSRYFTDLTAIFRSIGDKFRQFWEYIE